MRILDHLGLVPVIEAKDYGSAGIDGDSFKLDKAAGVSLLFNFGAITGNSILKMYVGATNGTKTTAFAYRYRLATSVYKAAATADQYDAVVAVPSTGLSLVATTFKNRTMVVDLDDHELALDATPWLTVEVDATATVLLLSCLAVLTGPRYKPALSEIV